MQTFIFYVMCVINLDDIIETCFPFDIKGFFSVQELQKSFTTCTLLLWLTLVIKPENFQEGLNMFCTHWSL